MIPRRDDHNSGTQLWCDRKMKRGMRIAALSASLAPTCRNSQKGVKKLLMAAAADEEGLQRRVVTINRHYARPPRLHCMCRRLPREEQGLYIRKVMLYSHYVQISVKQFKPNLDFFFSS